ncbi:MAG TPA: cell wall-binding repeat-containing protein, partial [Nitriliruptorales bacterium]
GGSAAVGDPVVQRLEDLGYQVKRLAGTTRYGTTTAVAADALARHADGEVIVVFATGEVFADGLPAGALAARFRALVVLVHPTDLDRSPEVESFLAAHAERFDQAVIVGGPLAVSDEVRTRLAKAMQAS